MVSRIRRAFAWVLCVLVVLFPQGARAQGEDDPPGWFDPLWDFLDTLVSTITGAVSTVTGYLLDVIGGVMMWVYEALVTAFLDLLCFLVSAFLTLFDPWITELGELVQSVHVSHPGMYDFYEAAVVLNEWFPITWALMLVGASLTVQLSLGALGWVLTAIPTMGR